MSPLEEKLPTFSLFLCSQLGFPSPSENYTDMGGSGGGSCYSCKCIHFSVSFEKWKLCWLLQMWISTLKLYNSIHLKLQGSKIYLAFFRSPRCIQVSHRAVPNWSTAESSTNTAPFPSTTTNSTSVNSAIFFLENILKVNNADGLSWQVQGSVGLSVDD